MKAKPWLVAAASLGILISVHTSLAQDCSVGYTPDLSSYGGESTDGTNIYTAVYVDGSGTMSITGQCNDLPNIYHTVMLWNSIGTASSGWVPYGEYCPDCYISAEQDEEIPADPGTYEFAYEGQVWCNIGGLFFDEPGSVSIAITTTYGANTLGSQVVGDTRFCGYTPACSNGVQPTCGEPSWTTNEFPSSNSCGYYIRNSWLAVTIGGVLECVGAWFSAVGPGPCS